MSKQYTRSEVANSNNKDQTLLILHDKVYDIKSFLNEHPGGEEILLEHEGKDASEDFDDVGHSSDAFELMKKFKVGELVESERSNTTPKSWTPTSITKNEDNSQAKKFSVVAGIVAVAAIVYFTLFYNN